MGASEVVVCNRCTRYSENSGPEVGRTFMSLASAHFLHARNDETYFLIVLGALSWIMMLGITLARERISG